MYICNICTSVVYKTYVYADINMYVCIYIYTHTHMHIHKHKHLKWHFWNVDRKPPWLRFLKVKVTWPSGIFWHHLCQERQGGWGTIQTSQETTPCYDFSTTKLLSPSMLHTCKSYSREFTQFQKDHYSQHLISFTVWLRVVILLALLTLKSVSLLSRFIDFKSPRSSWGSLDCKSWGQRPEACNSLPGDPAAGGSQGAEVLPLQCPRPHPARDTETRATATIRGLPFQLSLSGLKVMTPEEQLQRRWGSPPLPTSQRKAQQMGKNGEGLQRRVSKAQGGMGSASPIQVSLCLLLIKWR